jgi:hypothetical protein
VVAEQSNGAEADGLAQNSAEEEEGFPEHLPGEIRHTLKFIAGCASNRVHDFPYESVVLHKFADGLD